MKDYSKQYLNDYYARKGYEEVDTTGIIVGLVLLVVIVNLYLIGRHALLGF